MICPHCKQEIEEVKVEVVKLDCDVYHKRKQYKVVATSHVQRIRYPVKRGSICKPPKIFYVMEAE